MANKKTTTPYKDLVNVATGTKKQVEACLSAVDVFDNEDAPDELVKLGSLLEQTAQACDDILAKADAED